jgi:colanic acid biosynthesis protein WcaH
VDDRGDERRESLGASHSLIPSKIYREIVSKIPVLCVDLLIWRDKKILLVKRKNYPLRNQWWVVGGRVLLGEDPKDAARRKAKEEVGLDIESVNFVGYYSDVFRKSAFKNKSCQTVSLVFLCKPKDGAVRLDAQSNNFKWADGMPARFKLVYS